MRTADDIARLTTEFLASNVPARCRNRGIDPPRPEGWFPHGYHREPEGDEWPAVFTAVDGEATELMEATEEGDDVLLVTWHVAIETWSKSDVVNDVTTPTKVTSQLHAAMKECLLDQQSMDEAGLSLVPRFESQYSHAFGAKTLKGNPYASGLLTFDVQTAELVDRAVLSEPPTDITIDTVPLED